MKYTVKRMAKIAGISVRTLHHYDAVGLLRPDSIGSNGYRYYTEKELLKLQQILFFKELDFSLEDIKKIINADHFDVFKALIDHKKMLQLKKERIILLLETVEQTMNNLKGGEPMKTDDLFSSFGDEKLVDYMNEAKQRWGNSKAYKQSMQRVKQWTKADYERIKEEGRKFTQELARAMDLEITSPDVASLIKRHRESIEYFYECSDEMYRGLADMYINDPRFTAHYDDVRPGLAKWLSDAIHYYYRDK